MEGVGGGGVLGGEGGWWRVWVCGARNGRVSLQVLVLLTASNCFQLLGCPPLLSPLRYTHNYTLEDSQAAAFLLWNTSAANGTAAQLLLPLGTQDAPGVDFSGSTNLLLRCEKCSVSQVSVSQGQSESAVLAWMQWSLVGSTHHPALPLCAGCLVRPPAGHWAWPSAPPCPAFVRRLSRPAPRWSLGLSIGSTHPALPLFVGCLARPPAGHWA